MIEVLESRIAPAAANLNLADLNGANGLRISGAAIFDGAGLVVSEAGDVNGDGFDDVIIGAPFADPYGRNSGAIYIVFGQAGAFTPNLNLSDLDGTNGFEITNSVSGNLGSVSTAGDVNGDGFDDVIIGAKFSSPNGLGSGASYVVFGKSGFPASLNLATLDGNTGFKLSGAAAGDGVGSSVSTAGDVNGDGFDDLIIGAYSGQGYVVLGQAIGFTANLNLSTLDGSNGYKFSLTSPYNVFVGAVGDVNGDGFDDVSILGFPSDIGTEAFVVFGQANGFTADLNLSTLDGNNGFKVSGATANRIFSLSGAGDVNGDGFDEVIISAGLRSYLIFGKGSSFTANLSISTLDGMSGFKLRDDSYVDRVSTAGDFNGDGFLDVIVAASYANSPNGQQSGTCYIVFGQANGFPTDLNLLNLDSSNGFKINGAGEYDRFGISVSAAGDVNGDGFDDVIVGTSIGGSPEYSRDEPGTSYVIFGFDSRLTVSSKNTQVAFQDVDGDRVTIKVGKGTIVPQDVVLGPDGQLQLLKLSQASDRFEGATIKITAKEGAGGDGLVNVGAIDAAGLDLAQLFVKGDVGQIDVGSESLSKAALKSLKVRSLGVLGDSTQIPGTVDPLLSQIAGSLPKFTVKTDVKNAVVDVSGRLGMVKIGASLTGDADAGAALLRSLAEFGRIVPRVSAGIPGSFMAANIERFSVEGTMSGGSVQSAGDIGSVSIGNGIMSGAIAADGRIPVVKVVGGLTSDDAARPAVVAALARLGSTRSQDAVAIDSMLVRGDVENARVLLGYNKEEIAKNPDASAGKVVVKGNWSATSLVAGVFDATNDGFGQNDTVVGGDTTPSIVARIASVVIKGSATGSTTEGDHYGITAQAIGKLSIAGEKVALSKTEKDDLLLDPVNGDFRLVEV